MNGGLRQYFELTLLSLAQIGFSSRVFEVSGADSRRGLSVGPAGVINLSQNASSQEVVRIALRMRHAVFRRILVKSKHSALALSASAMVLWLFCPRRSQPDSVQKWERVVRHLMRTVLFTLRARPTGLQCDSVSMAVRRLRQSGRKTKQH